ncbi:hypothetical protein RIVM261_030580 [Rivularia sp. IAM M-261]|nr:hypothetical protein RIVM261_030580 [Rivularia sp. IAM M-261]
MNSNGFTKLTNFINQLEKYKIYYTLAHHREEAIMVMVAIPGQRWEIEFFNDGSIEVERFISSSNGIEGETILNELFAAYIDDTEVLTVLS